MSEGKKWGQTVLGWFVVQDENGRGGDGSYQPFSDTVDSSASTAAASDSAPSTPPADAAAAAVPPPLSGPLPPVTGGKVDFAAVYDAAGVDAEEQGRVQKALDLLQSLPQGTDDTVKKQIVLASLKAFGVPVDKIIEAGVAEIQALESYIRGGAADTQKLIEESDARITKYEEQIKQLRQVMQQRVEEQGIAVRGCNDKKLEVQQILEFFGRDEVARVVKASPKLVEPAPPAAS